MSKEITNVKQDFCRRVKNLLEQHEKTESWLARETGYPKQTISDWLNPLKPSEPKASAILAIANVLKTSTDYLLGIATQNDPSLFHKHLRNLTGLSAKALDNLNRLKQPDNYPVFTPESLLNERDAGVWFLRAAPAYVGSPRWAMSLLLEDADFILLAYSFLTALPDSSKGRLEDMEAYGILHLLDERLIRIRQENLKKVERVLTEEKIRETIRENIKQISITISSDTLEMVDELFAQQEGFDSVEEYRRHLEKAFDSEAWESFWNDDHKDGQIQLDGGERDDE